MLEASEVLLRSGNRNVEKKFHYWSVWFWWRVFAFCCQCYWSEEFL